MTAKPHVAIRPSVENIPDDLKSLPRWVLWRHTWIKKQNKWAKLPLQLDGSAADTTNPADWTTFAEASLEFVLGDYDGLGFVFNGDGIIGIDLDDAVDPLLDTYSKEAKTALDLVPGYAELSPSGKGLHIITRAKPSVTGSSPGIEVYETGRYFTFTGAQLNGHDSLPRSIQDIEPLLEIHFGSRAPVIWGDDSLSRKQPLGWSAEKIRSYLSKIEPPAAEPEWVPYIWAIHHETAGSEEGRAIAHEWSRGDLHNAAYAEYDVAALDERWNRAKDGKATAITFRTIKSKVESSGGIAPEWAARYVFVQESGEFFHLDTRQSMKVQAFDLSHTRDVEPNEKGVRMPASKFATQVLNLPCVAGLRYVPGSGELFNMNGVQFANRWSAGDGAVMPDSYSVEDVAAIRLFERHVKTIFRTETDATVFLDYLTYSIQNPGAKINWAILMQGVYGDGKTLFAELCAAMLGLNNVRIINGADLKDTFNGWIEEGHLGFVEEVKLVGENGHAILNRLKDLVTNRIVTVRRMHRANIQVPNGMNLVFFSNFRNALPIDDSDNRYYIIFSRWNNVDELERWKLQPGNEGFFDSLYLAIRNHPGAFRKWFMTRKVSDSFRASGRAPAGGAKAEMLRMVKDEYQTHIEDLLAEKGGVLGKNEVLLSSTWLLSEWFSVPEGPEKPHTSKFNAVMQRAGWVQVVFYSASGDMVDRIKVGTRPHRFWTRRMSELLGVFGTKEGRVKGPEVTLQLKNLYTDLSGL